jgi:hypothetical protein
MLLIVVSLFELAGWECVLITLLLDFFKILIKLFMREKSDLLNLSCLLVLINLKVGWFESSYKYL